MNQTHQVKLLKELIGLQSANALFLDDAQSTSPVESYLDSNRFDREIQRVFHARPAIVAHSSELPSPDCFARSHHAGRPLIISRGSDSKIRVFMNVCRHRGMQLVSDATGCKNRFTCPYHWWTWSNNGQFFNAPHFEAGFPASSKDQLGLAELPCIEKHGFVWLLPQGWAAAELTAYLGELEQDFDWFDSNALQVHASQEQTRHCNWRLLVEGGLEAYHFRVAHRNTIAPLFNDNLSSYEVFGENIRSILPRSSIAELPNQPESEWNIREHAQVLYSLMPGSVLLVQANHIEWISFDPETVDRSRLKIVTLKPRSGSFSDSFWDKNHALTVKTLNEDFDIAEGIQKGLKSGANSVFNFGRFEGALKVFNDQINSLL